MKYTPFEVEAMLDSMVILVDTREQPGKKLEQRTKGFACPFQRTKLDFGDYSCKYIDMDEREISLSHHVALERKMDANELAMCFTKDRSRFEKEFQRAAATGARLYLLIENETWEKVYAGKYGANAKYRSRLNPKALRASILAWAVQYDVHTHFCQEATTGRLIRDILHYELKEYLEHEQ